MRIVSAPSGASSAPNTSVPFTLGWPSTRWARWPTALPTGGGDGAVSVAPTCAAMTAATILR